MLFLLFTFTPENCQNDIKREKGFWWKEKKFSGNWHQQKWIILCLEQPLFKSRSVKISEFFQQNRNRAYLH